jgi:hypothetical protein
MRAEEAVIFGENKFVTKLSNYGFEPLTPLL